MQHEICENVHTTHTGGQLGSRRTCQQCKKNPNHVNFIRACEFQLSHCDIWKDKNLPPYLDLDDVSNLIKSLIPLTVRLHSTFVSTDRPDVYPLSNRRGTELKLFRNVGSGLVQWVLDRNDWFGCETCRHTWSVQLYMGMYGCPRDGCKGRRWRARSAEDGRCPWCKSGSVEVNSDGVEVTRGYLHRFITWFKSDSVEVGGGIFQCRRDEGSGCWFRDTRKWKVVDDSEVGTCPWCGEE